MPNLEDALQTVAKKGQLNHLSVIAHTSRDGVVTFRASYRNVKGDGHRIAEDADPVAALVKVLGVK